MDGINRKEIVRQLLHLGGFLLVAVPSDLNFQLVGAVLIGVALLGALYSELTERREEIKKRVQLPEEIHDLEEKGYRLVREYERDNVRLFHGAIMFFAGIGISMVVFPREVATLCVIALSVGDAFSSLVGIHWGRMNLPHWVSNHKTWEGTLSAFVSVLAAAWFFTTPGTALLTAFVGSGIEAFDTPVDDNVAIPLFTGTALLLLPTALAIL